MDDEISRQALEWTLIPFLTLIATAEDDSEYLVDAMLEMEQAVIFL